MTSHPLTIARSAFSASLRSAGALQTPVRASRAINAPLKISFEYPISGVLKWFRLEEVDRA